VTLEIAAPALTTAPLGRRLLALLIDLFVGFLITQAVFRAFGQELFVLNRDIPSAARAATLSWAVVYNTLPVVLWGGTPGKLLMRLYIAHSNGRRVSLWTAVLRDLAFNSFYVSYIASILDRDTSLYLIDGIVLVVSLVMLFSDSDQRRALHDRIAGTRVLMGRPHPGSSEAY
jgi:uncharacterized RDD family membrane protein YckC